MQAVDKDVPGACSILSSMQPSAKLSERLQEVDIVTAHKVLGQVDDGGHEGLL